MAQISVDSPLSESADAAAEYRGDIYALAEDAGELIGLGVRIGHFDAACGCFIDCRLSAGTLGRLQVLGGKYLWDLEPVAVAVGGAPQPRRAGRAGGAPHCLH